MERDEDGLTPRQRRFIDALIATGDPAQAYLDSDPGTSATRTSAKREAAHFLKDKRIKAALVKTREVARADNKITLEFLTERLVEALDMAEKIHDSKGMVSAISQLSKMYGFDANPRSNERSPLTEALELLHARRAASSNGQIKH